MKSNMYSHTDLEQLKWMVLFIFVYGVISEHCWYMTIIWWIPNDIFDGDTFFNQKTMECSGNWDSPRAQGFPKGVKPPVWTKGWHTLPPIGWSANWATLKNSYINASERWMPQFKRQPSSSFLHVLQKKTNNNNISPNPKGGELVDVLGKWVSHSPEQPHLKIT